jgi:hypothetical protein
MTIISILQKMTNLMKGSVLGFDAHHFCAQQVVVLERQWRGGQVFCPAVAIVELMSDQVGNP